MTQTPESPKWNYSFIADTILEVNKLAAELQKVMLANMSLKQKKELLESRISAYEIKISEMKSELVTLFSKVYLNEYESTSLVETINEKLGEISIDPQTFWEGKEVPAEGEWIYKFDLSQFEVTVPLDEDEEEKLIQQVINEFNTVTFPQELKVKRLQAQILKKIAGNTFAFRWITGKEHWYADTEGNRLYCYGGAPSEDKEIFVLADLGCFIGNVSNDSIIASTNLYSQIRKFVINDMSYYKVKGKNGKRAIMNSAHKFLTWFVYASIRTKDIATDTETLPATIKNTDYTKYRKKLEGITNLTNHRSEWFDINLKGRIVRNRPSSKKNTGVWPSLSKWLITDQLKAEKFLDLHISELDMSVRAHNTLLAREIHTFRELLEGPITQYEFEKSRNVWKRTITEIKSILAKYGLEDKRRVE